MTDREGRRDTSDAGVSLVELLVASTISVLLLTLIGAMFIQITKATSDGRTTRSSTGVAWTVLDEISRVVRQGTQVMTSATATEGAVLAGSTPTSLTIDTNSNATVTAGQAAIAPTRVTFSVNASGYLVEQRTAAVLTSGYFAFTATPTTRIVNGPILTTGTGTDALFVYSDADGDPIVPATTGLTAAQAAQVTSVTVNVAVANTLSTGSAPVRLTNQITMPNIAIVNGGS